MNVLRFSQGCKRSIILFCFSALRIHKEKKKHNMIRAVITKDIDIAIDGVSDYLEKKQLVNSTKSLRESTSVISTMLSKRIF